RLDAATLALRSPAESVRLELLEPIEPHAGGLDRCVARVSGGGSVQAWVARLQPWLEAMPEEASGGCEFEARVEWQPTAVNLRSLQLTADDLQIHRGNFTIDENRLELSGDVQWDASGRDFRSTQLALVSTTLSARSRDLRFTQSEQGAPQIGGAVAFRADLERLAAIGGMAGRSDGPWPQGFLDGRLETKDAGSSIDVEITAQPVHLVELSPVSQPGTRHLTPIWSEPNLRAEARLIYRRDDDRLEASQLKVEGSTLQVAGDVTIDQLSGVGAARGELTVTYDEQAAANLIASYLGPEVRVEGAKQAQVSAVGQLRPDPSDVQANQPHWSRRWNVSADAGWSAVDFFGLPVGPALLAGRLENGKILLKPIDVAVGDGRLTVQARVLLDAGPAELQVAKGPLATNVAVSKEVSETMLKFAAPMFAGATQAEGEFSIDLDGVRLPLRHAEQSDAAGRLVIHRLAIAPGPIIQDVAQALRRIEALSRKDPLAAGTLTTRPARQLTVVDRTVDVRVTKGRVYHRNLEFLIDDVAVRSAGWVGFNEEMQVNIEIPIPEKWLSKEGGRSLLAGQTLQIVLTGTLSRPRIDDRAAMQNIQSLLRNAAEQMIGDELNRALDRLLRPR
ncbi:MAG: hypothetical protein AAF961_02550, partial [Planctomycetota bacterium]